jgi:hypothetical protein
MNETVKLNELATELKEFQQQNNLMNVQKHGILCYNTIVGSSTNTTHI